MFLCPGAEIALYNAISFYAANQTITTGTGVLGSIIGGQRATLKVMGSSQSTAIVGVNLGSSGCRVSNLIVDGGRQRLGRLASGGALLAMGGTENVGQVVSGCKLFEPRGWTALHLIEGHNLSCRDGVVTNNEIGPW